MAFFGTKVEKQSDRERDRRPAKLLVERRRWKWAHMPTCGRSCRREMTRVAVRRRPSNAGVVTGG